jgi:NAD(P)-dependent dehydrogenase (short-subunit alcohol dehydrogenase family)
MGNRVEGKVVVVTGAAFGIGQAVARRLAREGVEAYRRALDERHPIGHVGEPDDIAWGALYLASDEAKFVTGSELVIDGGYTAR